MNDMQAIRCLKRGDISGLETLVERYQVRAGRVASLITHDERLAEDIVQESFVCLYRSIHRFDEARPFEPYFLRSVVNAAVNALKRESRQVPYDPIDAAELENLMAYAAHVEDQAEFAQLKQEIWNALHKLSARERAAIVQRYYLEMSEKEMALALDVAPGTVKWLLNVARTKLRLLLNSERSAE